MTLNGGQLGIVTDTDPLFAASPHLAAPDRLHAECDISATVP